jgi:hypothetical protein
MFHREEYIKLVNAGYMSSDPAKRQEVFGDGDNISLAILSSLADGHSRTTTAHTNLDESG